MAKLRDLAQKVRSKNAGPFWITVDIFCGTADAFQSVKNGLTTSDVARLFGTETQTMKRFDIPDLNVVKLSFPRPNVQGTIQDRDMHGASWAALLAEMDIE